MVAGVVVKGRGKEFTWVSPSHNTNARTHAREGKRREKGRREGWRR